MIVVTTTENLFRSRMMTAVSRSSRPLGSEVQTLILADVTGADQARRAPPAALQVNSRRL